MSWSSSLLFVLQYGLYRHHNEKDGSAFSDIHLLVIDTRQLPPRTFVKDLEIIPIFAPFNGEWNQYKDLSRILNLRQSDYYFGEYLSQGDLDLTGKAAQTSLQQLIDLGLFSLVPQMRDEESWGSWARPVVGFRKCFNDTADVYASRTEVRRAITIAEGAFGGPWTIPVSAMLLALQPRQRSDSAIVRGFEAMFTEAEFRTASLSEMYIDEERLPEVAQFRRLIGDIDSYLSPVDDMVNSFEALGIEA
ncbi:hypothetical protein SLS53_006131 [Cytospora paraplurivora]|uniref:Uncharacterized protein n=1 Tax=Cytospora paraplurivora TaxID=2898453 RepID=A0AAN9U442_9PEZI